MMVLKYLLLILGTGFFASAGAILGWDLYQIVHRRREAARRSVDGQEAIDSEAEPVLRFSTARYLAFAGLGPFLLGSAIVIVPAGKAGVRVSQFGGVRPGTLYPGVHLVLPGVDQVELYPTRDQIFATPAVDTVKEEPGKKTDVPKRETLRVQTKEGLTAGLSVSVRYRLDPRKLDYIQQNLPQPVDSELIVPVITSVFREITPDYMVRELFSTRRQELALTAAAQIRQRLGRDGVVVKEVILRDVQLPAEYAKGLEGLLLKEQENERMSIDLEVKQKLVRSAELESEAQKAREVKEAESQAQIVVIQAKAQADAMQHTLPLKEKQIQQSRLEAEARKEATVKNAEAMAAAKVIDSKAEVEKRRLMSESDEYHIRRIASADAERMKLEATVLKENPLLIQKIIAEKLSDKVQIMMVPNDGKFFFANDVLKGMPVSETVRH